jgi:hypothetical protein
MTQEAQSADTHPRARFTRAALLTGASLLPPAIVTAIHFWSMHADNGYGYGYGKALNSFHAVPVIGEAVYHVHRVIASIYFPPFWVTGSVDPELAWLGLYLLFAMLYFIRRRWIAGAGLLVLPLLVTWILTASLAGG